MILSGQGKDYEPDYVQFARVCEEIRRDHIPLNLTHIHRVFGQPFFEIMMYALTDAREAGQQLGIKNPSSETQERIKRILHDLIETRQFCDYRMKDTTLHPKDVWTQLQRTINNLCELITLRY